MKIHLLSDIHLEFYKNKRAMSLAGGDVLILAGDIYTPHKDKFFEQLAVNEFFKKECVKYTQVFYVLGNHEHYFGDFLQTKRLIHHHLRGTNIKILDKEFMDLENGWQIFGATFWTDYHNNDYFAKHCARTMMADHVIITKDGVGFHPDDAIKDHEETLESFNSIFDLERIYKPTIVVSHHAPTSQSVHDRYRGSQLNDAYYSDLEGIILDHPNIKYWFHGHMHDSFDYMVGGCRVVCNPGGYYPIQTNKDFNPKFEFDIT